MPNRQNKKGRSRFGPPFVQLPKFMLDSPAWLALSPPARAAYVELERVYNGANNGMIAMSVRRLAKRLRCSKTTAGRVLIDLEDAGFIETVEMGCFSRKNRRASEYRLTIHHCDLSGHRPSKKFMQWVPPGPESRQRDRIVSPEGHTQQTYHSRSRQRDRQHENPPVHGPTTGTLIESHQGGTRATEGDKAGPLIAGGDDDGLDIPPFLDRRPSTARECAPHGAVASEPVSNIPSSGGRLPPAGDNRREVRRGRLSLGQ